ncbi:hypothetical protein ElyMa_005554600, partial [Elysia marginata]
MKATILKWTTKLTEIKCTPVLKYLHGTKALFSGQTKKRYGQVEDLGNMAYILRSAARKSLYSLSDGSARFFHPTAFVASKT